MKNITETTRKILSEMDTFGVNANREARGLSPIGYTPRNPSYRPGAHNPMSTSHHSMNIDHSEYKQRIAKEPAHVQKASADAHKLSDHADSHKYTVDNHEALAKHHTAAFNAHSNLARHFGKLAKEHGGTSEANDTSGTWHDSSGYGGTHWVHNSPEAKHYAQLERYHDNAASYHHSKGYAAKTHAPMYHKAIKTSFSAKNAPAKKKALARADDAKRSFEFGSRVGKNLTSHISATQNQTN